MGMEKIERSKPTCLFVREKIPKKVLFFGGISRLWKSPLIAVFGTISGNVYADECIDGSGMIYEMDHVDGQRSWVLYHDGATAHTCEAIMV